MKHRPHCNPWRTDHITSGTCRVDDDLVFAHNLTIEEGCYVTLLKEDGEQKARRYLVTWMKKTNIIHRLNKNYDRGRVSFITNRQLLKYKGFSRRSKKVL